MNEIEGNKLIAAFMDFKVTEKQKPHHELVWYDWDGAKDVLYHESWDWLMPVVEKINEVHPMGIAMHYKISEQYKVVVSFIQWYNYVQEQRKYTIGQSQ